MAPTGSIDIRATFGSALIGALVTMILYGVTALQTYMYFIRYPKDPRWTKNIVSSLWIMDTFHICLVSHAIYYYLVINYDNPASLQAGIWSLYLSIGVNVTIAFVTQCFFTHRLHQLSGGKWWITGPIFITVIAHFCFGIGISRPTLNPFDPNQIQLPLPLETMIELYQKEDFNNLSQITYIAALPFAVLAVLSDVLITVALCVLLHNSRTGFRSTNSMLNLIIVYAINRCLLTSIIAIIEMVMFVTAQETLWYLAADFVVGKLYANSLLATLNSRSALAGKGMEDEEDADITNTSLHIGGFSQPIVLESQYSTKRFDGPKKVENEVVSVSMVNPQADSRDTSFGTKHSGSKRTGNATRGTSSSNDLKSGSKRSGSKLSESLVLTSKINLSSASGSKSSGSKESESRVLARSSLKDTASPASASNRSGGDHPESQVLAQSGNSDGKDRASPSNRSGGSGGNHSESTKDEPSASKISPASKNEQLSENEPPVRKSSVHSTTHSTFGSASSSGESDKVEVSVRSVAQSSSAPTMRSNAKASTIDEETHMIDV
ncbi:hypothetical protein SCHPADRAFT_464941 [Schizopora paradoxa]|uniref:DUF6534 domain-containing protein n=1 Tax=Schizopora paradoxa TaxID=27342 RepID=A0A0H2RIC8_9AGAM|nr:hypothetical protein SCHPADRAFT_464941 [Schizopora paradoxa]